jgi:hypothetical protein
MSSGWEVIPVAKIRDWKDMKTMSVRLLEKRTGEGLAIWNRRVLRERFGDEKRLRVWLTKQGVTGYAQDLLVWERFGYPDFLVATADELIEGQYADRPQLRPILDTILKEAEGLGHHPSPEDLRLARFGAPDICPCPADDEGPRRSGPSSRGTEARWATAALDDSGDDASPDGLTAREDVDSEVLTWLRRAYEENR